MYEIHVVDIWIVHVWHMKERHLGRGRSMQRHACQARVLDSMQIEENS